jgi:putative oxidoreductase
MVLDPGEHPVPFPPACRINHDTRSAQFGNDFQTVAQDSDSDLLAVRIGILTHGLKRFLKRKTMFQAFRGPLAVLGRLLLCTIFLMAALANKIPYFGEVTKVMESAGSPAPEFMLVGAIVFLIVGSVSVTVGYKGPFGAVLLLIFLVLATYYFHAFWNREAQAREQQMAHFIKNLSMMGAMLFIVANGPGPMSVDTFLKKRAKAPQNLTLPGQTAT